MAPRMLSPSSLELLDDDDDDDEEDDDDDDELRVVSWVRSIFPA